MPRAVTSKPGGYLLYMMHTFTIFSQGYILSQTSAWKPIHITKRMGRKHDYGTNQRNGNENYIEQMIGAVKTVQGN